MTSYHIMLPVMQAGCCRFETAQPRVGLPLCVHVRDTREFQNPSRADGTNVAVPIHAHCYPQNSIFASRLKTSDYTDYCYGCSIVGGGD